MNPVPRMTAKGKTFFVALLMILPVVWATGCARIQTLPATGIPTVAVADFARDPARYGFELRGKGAPRVEGDGLIVKIPAGTRVPLKLTLDVGVVALDAGTNHLRTLIEIRSPTMRASRRRPSKARRGSILDVRNR